MRERKNRRPELRLRRGGGRLRRSTRPGATLGAIGLVGFALLVWKMLPDYGTEFVLLSATLTWLALAITTWVVWKKRIWRTAKSNAAGKK